MSLRLTPAVVKLEWRQFLSVAFMLLIAVWEFSIAVTWIQNNEDSPAIVESTLGQLAIWLSEQAQEEEPESILGQYARVRLETVGNPEQLTNDLLREVRSFFSIHSFLVGILALAVTFTVWRNSKYQQIWLVFLLLANGANLFVYSPSADDFLFYSVVAIGWLVFINISVLSIKKNRIVSFFAFVSLLLLGWEMVKLGAELVNYRVTRSLPDWGYVT